MPMLEVNNLNVHYGAIHALRGINIDVRRGEIVTLIGANGAGKSTLLMTVCGNPRARAGTIRLDSGVFRLQSIGDNEHFLVEINPERLPPD